MTVVDPARTQANVYIVCVSTCFRTLTDFAPVTTLPDRLDALGCRVQSFKQAGSVPKIRSKHYTK